MYAHKYAYIYIHTYTNNIYIHTHTYIHIHIYRLWILLSPPLVLSPSALSTLEYNISAAAIAIFSLFFMILGTLCVIFSFGKGRDYLLRPAGMFFAFAGQRSRIITMCNCTLSCRPLCLYSEETVFQYSRFLWLIKIQ